MNITITVDSNPTDDDLAAIDHGLSEANAHAANLSAVKSFTSVARNEQGAIVGGCLARRWGRACEVQQLWVDEQFRRQSIASKLMESIEAHAANNGCSYIYLETFSFQAPAFYAKRGYYTVCTFDGYADGISKFIMRKDLP